MQWIPIVTRKLTDDEIKNLIETRSLTAEELKDFEKITSLLPEDGEEVLITTNRGEVCIDIYIEDGVLSGFEDHYDWDDVLAWMPLPKAYERR